MMQISTIGRKNAFWRDCQSTFNAVVEFEMVVLDVKLH